MKIETIKSICGAIAQLQIVLLDQSQKKTQEDFENSLPKMMDFLRQTYVELDYCIRKDKPSQSLINQFQFFRKATDEEIKNINASDVMQEQAKKTEKVLVVEVNKK